MKELSPTTIMKPSEVIINIFSVSVSVSFFLFPCSKGQVVRTYLDTILMTLYHRKTFFRVISIFVLIFWMLNDFKKHLGKGYQNICKNELFTFGEVQVLVVRIGTSAFCKIITAPCLFCLGRLPGFSESKPNFPQPVIVKLRLGG